jgi:4-amino-4-deoxy-L-arabinose transferase-like glycosyltransferase
VSFTSPVVRRAVLYCLLLTAASYFLFFHGLTATGLLGPDEPRYAAIGREMARSGDWITPRLWGEPWFEKPALLYWMTGLAFRAGLGEELAPRLPVALLGVGFLGFYWWALRRQFGSRAAFFSTALLGTSAVWLSFSHAGVTDLPMAAAFAAAMLLCLGWIHRQECLCHLWVAAALLGLAVLAKGLVPLVLALPLAWVGRRRVKDWVRPGPIAAFLAVAAPWYVLCYVANGQVFLSEFFIRHHLGRYSSDALQHPQPFWFYLPVMLGALFPWTPLLVLVFRRVAYRDPRRRFLLLWVVFGLVFLSVAVNKLPGYVLPLLPALAALVGLELAEVRRAGWLLAACALLLVLVPVIGAALPDALTKGLTRARLPEAPWAWLPSVALLAGLVWWLESRGRRGWAVGAVVVAVVAAALWMKTSVFPVLDRKVSARNFWRQMPIPAAAVCVEEANRSWLYGLNYYSMEPLPACEQEPRQWRLRQGPVGPTLYQVRAEP